MNVLLFFIFFLLIVVNAAQKNKKTYFKGSPPSGRFLSPRGLSSRYQRKTISLGTDIEKKPQPVRKRENKPQISPSAVDRTAGIKRNGSLNLFSGWSSVSPETDSGDDSSAPLPDSNCYFDTPSDYTSVSTCISSTSSSSGRASEPPPHCINEVSELVFINGSFSADQSFLNCLNNIPDAASLASFYNGSYHGCLLMETTVTLLNLVKVSCFFLFVPSFFLSFFLRLCSFILTLHMLD
jgi:hypothetical protein